MSIHSWTTGVLAQDNGISLVRGGEHIEVLDNRSIAQRIVDLAQAYFRQLATWYHSGLGRLRVHFLDLPYPRPVTVNGSVEYPDHALPWLDAEHSEGLYVFVHGLRGTPINWELYEQQVMNEHPGAHLFIPHVHEGGNCPLKEAAAPIIRAVQTYHERFPGRPIYLFGTSNGSRIALEIENSLLANEGFEAPLRLVSIAGVINGTQLIADADRFQVTSLFGLHPDLTDEFRHSSDVAQEQLRTWRGHRHRERDVKHYCYATAEDGQVYPNSTSLPYHEAVDSYYSVLTGHTHTSIVAGVCEDVFRQIWD